MRKPKIYVETSVWSQALAEDAPPLREATLAFLAAAKEHQLPLFVSEVVFAEFSKATEELGERLRGLVRQLSPSIIPLNDEANRLAQEYLRFGIVPPSKVDDARHVAVAVAHELDILVSWNYRHLVNLKRREAFHYSSAINGYLKPLQIVTPPEVGYEFQQNLEEVWRWKEDVARETQDMSEEEQLAYFHRVSREFLEKADSPLELPVYQNAPSSLSQS